MYKIQVARVKLSNLISKSRFINTNQMSIHLFPVMHLYALQNYVEYIFFFLPLLKVVSKILCHVFIVMLQLHNYKFEAKNNRRFCYNNWRHVGEYV